tara:strand:- start:12300 stop:12794 length:495 start_codon:yes stop_codon:yes gene_type:complete
MSSESISLEEFRDLTNKGAVTSFCRGKGKRKRRVDINSSESIRQNDSGRKGKYNAKKVTVNGLEFDSKIEGARYIFLLEQQRKGHIYKLELQKKFDIEINGQFICSYKADFCYFKKVDDQKNMYVVEDVKGMKTPVYRLKKKMLKASLGHEIVEVTKENLTELK